MTASRADLRLHRLALIAAVAGAAIGFAASLLSIALHGRFAVETFQGSLFALTAAVPVYVNYRRLLASSRDDQ